MKRRNALNKIETKQTNKSAAATHYFPTNSWMHVKWLHMVARTIFTFWTLIPMLLSCSNSANSQDLKTKIIVSPPFSSHSWTRPFRDLIAQFKRCAQQNKNRWLCEHSGHSFHLLIPLACSVGLFFSQNRVLVMVMTVAGNNYNTVNHWLSVPPHLCIICGATDFLATGIAVCVTTGHSDLWTSDHDVLATGTNKSLKQKCWSARFFYESSMSKKHFLFQCSNQTFFNFATKIGSVWKSDTIFCTDDICLQHFVSAWQPTVDKHCKANCCESIHLFAIGWESSWELSLSPGNLPHLVGPILSNQTRKPRIWSTSWAAWHSGEVINILLSFPGLLKCFVPWVTW